MNPTGRLLEDIADLKKNLTRIEDETNTINKIVHDLHSILNLPNQIETICGYITSSIPFIKFLVEAAAVVPALTAPAEAVQAVLPEIKETADEIQYETNEIDEEVRPARKAAKKAGKFFNTVQNIIKDSKSITDEYALITGKASNCINSLPQGETKETLREKLDGISSKSDSVIQKINKGFDSYFAHLEKIDRIFEQLQPAFDLLEKVEKPIDKVEKALNKTLKPALNLLYDELEKTYTISFSYDAYFTSYSYEKDIKYKTIMKYGSKGMDAYMDNLLPWWISDLLDIATSKYADKVLDTVESNINKVLEKTHLTSIIGSIDLSIPGVDELKKIHSLLKTIHTLEGLLNDFENIQFFNEEICHSLDDMNELYEQCVCSLK